MGAVPSPFLWRKGLYYYSGKIAGISLPFAFHYQDTAVQYRNALAPSEDCRDALSVPENDIRDWMLQWDVKDPAYSEYVMSCSYACDRLMLQHRVVFHGAAILWNGAAYLFSAPSGTGKTTQARLWESCFPGEALILNGDKPILEACEDGTVLVHPSPWKGKEGYGRDDITAPLTGIIMLRKAPENAISRVRPAEAARDLFGRIYSTFSTPEDVLHAAGILEAVLRSVPVWLLRNRGDADSVMLTHKTIQEEVGK